MLDGMSADQTDQPDPAEPAEPSSYATEPASNQESPQDVEDDTTEDES